ncbi:MAG: multifunctional CCA tRNA nucleotidyl transferase/2'3'-cyclic phosphodiesterase/2'nucleotidase/phosphatase [Gammaproteobacteria bacterium]|nr:multifunctional CCA tRNA nucleotidyl transferase/2'3'-cyclic phosphodiesterase/2'nucleotidase/phosphatase [Gammaproteobacteria bacterium]
MQIYLVGGAVRDELLGLPVHERDWVVIGATPDDLLAQGYQQVGKNFPVFLHPESKEEYALARTERKKGIGHTGFNIDANPNVTLEQDLQRRDLTINAIARDAGGKLVDPFGGLDDIAQRQLRHVSDAFIEDPLRVLRVARFKAKLHHLGFSIASETMALMKTISASGELQSLPAERVWREFDKGLGSPSPDAFMQALYQCDALQALLPELEKRWRATDNLRGAAPNVGERLLLALRSASQRSANIAVRWALCCHALAANAQPANLRSAGQAENDSARQAVASACARVCAPARPARLGELAAMHANFMLQAVKARPDALLALMERGDAWRRGEEFLQLIEVAECLAGSAGHGEESAASLLLLRQALAATENIDAAEFVANGLTGPAVGEAVRNARKVALAALKKQFA